MIKTNFMKFVNISIEIINIIYMYSIDHSLHRDLDSLSPVIHYRVNRVIHHAQGNANCNFLT